MDVAIALRTLFNHHLHQHHCHYIRSLLSLASSWKLQPNLPSAGYNRVSLLISQYVHQSQKVVSKRRFSFFGVENIAIFFFGKDCKVHILSNNVLLPGNLLKITLLLKPMHAMGVVPPLSSRRSLPYTELCDVKNLFRSNFVYLWTPNS